MKLLLAVAAVGCVLVGPSIALAAEDAPAPKLAIANPDDTIEVDTESVAGSTATGRLLLVNTGGAAATGLTYAAWVEGELLEVSGGDLPTELPEHAVHSTVFNVSLPEGLTTSSGRFIVQSAETGPIVAALTFDRAVGDGAVWVVIGVAALLTIATGAGIMTVKPAPSLSRKLHLEKGWKFSESWASTLVAVGALLATVLAASDIFDAYLFGVQKHTFIGLSLLFGGFVAAAPVVLMALASNESGTIVHTVRSLLAGSSVTLMGVYGQLATIALVVWAATPDLPEQILLYGLLVLAAVFVAMYANTTICTMADTPPPPPAPAEGGQAEPQPAAVTRSAFL